MRHYVLFKNRQDEEPVSAELRTLVKAVIYETLEYEDFGRSAEVSVTFVNDAGMRIINQRYRGVDSATDVLSFPIISDEDGDSDVDSSNGAAMLGDIVISLERARRQAAQYGHSYTREVAFLTVHSVLHLLGYDHLTSEADDADMRRRQDAVLEYMGISRK